MAVPGDKAEMPARPLSGLTIQSSSRAGVCRRRRRDCDGVRCLGRMREDLPPAGELLATTINDNMILVVDWQIVSVVG